MHPGFKIPQEPVALMAGNEDDEGAHGGMGAQTAPWKRQRGEQGLWSIIFYQAELKW